MELSSDSDDHRRVESPESLVTTDTTDSETSNGEVGQNTAADSANATSAETPTPTPTHLVHTVSTESTATVRGGPALVSPSYPFPIVEGSQSNTSAEYLTADAAHKPFTTLSPTVTPSPAKLAKHRVSQDFRASGHLPSSATPTPPSSRRATTLESVLGPRPNVLDIAVTVQSEPGIVGWWSQLTQVLKDSFGAERATLAVATDSTDIENVPWAQLASFSAGEDDNYSRVANEDPSSKGSMNDVLSPDPSLGEWGRDRDLSGAFRSFGLSPAANSSSQPRPKLESRHSYAGYPLKHQKGGMSEPLQPHNSYTIGMPTSPLRNPLRPTSSEDDGFVLSAEHLRRHDYSEGTKTGSMSEDMYSTGKPVQGRILNPVQPLESEADPLLTTAGVLRVLGRGSATVLTRQFLGSQDHKLSDSRRNQSSSAKSNRHGFARLSPTLQSKSQSGVQANSSKVVTRKPGKSSKRRASGASSRSSTASSFPTTAESPAPLTPVYEDYEQYPGTPWAQSPAPSPAAQSDGNDNDSPFFSNVPDQDAFLEDVPEHPYDRDGQIPAIGTDRSQSIIQLPLFHPSDRLSQTHQPQTIRDEHGSAKKHGRRSDKDRSPHRSRTSPRTSLDNRTMKRVPIAILSIMSPSVPYHVELVAILNELSAVLATSFYAARSYSTLLLETAALGRRRQNLGIKLSAQDEQSLSNIALATGLNFVGASRERLVSPTSVSSSASTSTQSTQPFHSPKGSVSGGSNAATPAWEGYDPTSRSSTMQVPARSPGAARSPGPRSPRDENREIRGDYFHSVLSPQKRHKEESTAPKTPARKSMPSRTASATARKPEVIHSHGASFANTQPSLPKSSTGLSTEDGLGRGNVPQSTAPVFMEPSSSVLRAMIDNGATQQFIAERENGNLVWANSKFLSYRNTSKENIHEQLWKNIYHRDIRRFQREWESSLESGEQLSHQVRLKRFDGQYRWFHIRFLPLKDKHGITKYWHGQAMDIHDLHEAEVKAAKSKEKAASEAKYRAIANSLPVIVFAASVPTGMTFANTQWLSYSGQDLEEALGFGFLDHIHPDDLVKCRFPGFDAQAAKITKPVRPLPSRHSRSDLSVSSAADSDETTSTAKVPSSRRNDDQNELAIPNELLRELKKDGIIMCHKDEQGNLSITTEMRLKNRKGDYRWHLVQGSFIESVDFGKGEAQWFIACTDISNQKHNEAKIQQANSALENVNMALEKEMRRKMGYLSSMSHEIRTPLNGIIGNLQFLINSGLEESAGEWAHGAQEAAKNMHDLINDILDLSKAEANMLKLASHWFNPRGLNEQVLDMLNSKASEKGIELSNECADDVPKMIRGDSGRIRQVLLNLAGNGIKFTKVGEVTIKCDVLDKIPDDIELAPREANEIFIRWTITDTGSGFTEEDKKLLFKPYSQIKNKNTREAGGTGLGLILCKTMVALHGGAIEAEGKPGLGSVFSFFARFKVRKDSAVSQHMSDTSSQNPSLVKPTAPAIPSPISESPAYRQIIASEGALRASPGPLSDSSSAMSSNSIDNRTSVRSSMSTADSVVPIDLKLPANPHAPSLSLPAPGLGPPSPTSSGGRGSPLVSPKTLLPSFRGSLGPTADPERSQFRPPMLSVLVVCPAASTRRITCDQIKFTAPRSAPCNITSEGSMEAALTLLLGDDPVTFTHIVFRVAADDAMRNSLKKVLLNSTHSQACIVLITDQGGAKYLTEDLPEVKLDELNKTDRLKVVLKPAHTHKLAKIFDPFNENSLMTEDPKEAKRREEKRLQRESYALFKKVLGNKGVRVIAVEDNKLQMDILYNFLAKICFLDVTKAWNGQECLDLYTASPTTYSVIITDIEMPVMDGLTMCRRIRSIEEERNWPPVPIVSLSANTFYEGWTQSSNAGFTHYCGKPVNFRDLGHILLELTDKSVPHKFLRDRQMPSAMLKKLGLLPNGEDSDEEVEF